MEKVNYVLDMKNLNEEVKELVLTNTGCYNPDDIKVIDDGDKVTITQYIGEDEYRYYGFVRMNKFYIGRVQYIAGFPEDMEIDEFFDFGQEL
jgi:hypothetical protein